MPLLSFFFFFSCIHHPDSAIMEILSLYFHVSLIFLVTVFWSKTLHALLCIAKNYVHFYISQAIKTPNKTDNISLASNDDFVTKFSWFLKLFYSWFSWVRTQTRSTYSIGFRLLDLICQHQCPSPPSPSPPPPLTCSETGLAGLKNVPHSGFASLLPS